MTTKPVSPKRVKSVKLLRVPKELDQALFENPDATIVFNELVPFLKNKWIVSVLEAKGEKARMEQAQKVIKIILKGN
jgi:uncharacterized protein YdeI (YjbR/CyaY-like superfamily)